MEERLKKPHECHLQLPILQKWQIAKHRPYYRYAAYPESFEDVYTAQICQIGIKRKQNKVSKNHVNRSYCMWLVLYLANSISSYLLLLALLSATSKLAYQVPLMAFQSFQKYETMHVVFTYSKVQVQSVWRTGAMAYIYLENQYPAHMIKITQNKTIK